MHSLFFSCWQFMSPLKPPLDCSDEDIIIPPSEPTLSPVSPMCVSDLLCRELRPVQQILTDSDFDLDLENKPSLSTSFNPFDSSSSSLSSESCNPFDSSSSFSKPESCNSFNSSSSSSASGKTSSSLKAPSLFDYNKTYNFPSSPNDEQSAETNVSS